MPSGNRRIGAEIASVALIVASLGGAVHLVVTVHRRAMNDATASPVAAATAPPTVQVAATSTEPAPNQPVEPSSRPVAKKPKPTAPPPTPAKDPTPDVLARLAAETSSEAERASRLDAEARAAEQGKQSAEAEAEKWRRREMLVKQQLASLSEKARRLDRESDAYAAQRDVLAKERDALKAAFANAPGEGSYAVLPYQGSNGTWRRPIVIECSAGSVSIKPDGLSFSLLELSGLANPRSSPVVVAIAKELLKVRSSESPDGSPVVPYFVFLVRPDGIRSYYEARSRLEPLGIAFGYELVEQGLDIHVPNFDELATWDGSPSGLPQTSLAARPGASGGAGAGVSTSGGLAWPGEVTPAPTTAGPSGGTNGDGETPEDFVWSSRPAGSRAAGSEGGEPGEGRSLGGLGDGRLAGRGTGGGPRSKPTSGQGSGKDGLDSIVGSLPDFDRPDDANGEAAAAPGGRVPIGGLALGEERGRGLDPSRTSGGTRGLSPLTGGALPGRAWQSDGDRRPVSVGGGDQASASSKPVAENSAGGLMWGGDGKTSDPPATNGGLADGAGPPSTPSRPGSGEAKGGTAGPASANSKPAGTNPKTSADVSDRPRIGMGLDSPRLNAGSGGTPSPGLMLGGDPEPGSSGAAGASASKPDSDAGMGPLIPDRDRERPSTVEVPFEIVVACGSNGVTIQPGGYRITGEALRDRKQEDLLVRNLSAVARNRAEVDPAIHPRPRVKFLVENDGSATFWEARRQLLFSDLNWPMTLQVAGGESPRPFTGGTLR